VRPFVSANGRMVYGILKTRVSKVYFTLVKLPLMLFAIVAGFIFEFILELPFIFLIFLGYRSKKKKECSPDHDVEQLVLQKDIK
jgi:hypothetical protein